MRWLLMVLALLLAAGCDSDPEPGDDGGGPPPGTDGGGAADAGPPRDGGGPGADGGGPGTDAGPPPVTECNDGVDNDGDGLVDWQLDVGCWSAADGTESAGPREEENGFTTFDLSDDSRIVYVSSSEGDDGNDGLSPETAVATPQRGAELVRDGMHDFLLFRRGDTWRGMTLGDGRVARRFKSGQDADHPLVVSSYGDSIERPRFEVDTNFVDDDGNDRSFLAFVGLAIISYPKDPDDPDFDGENGGAFRFVGRGGDILLEDNYLEYGEFVIQNVSDVQVRRNVVWRSYHVGTCAYNPDGSRNPNGDSTFRPSGIFAGRVDGLFIEGNVWDENGWNPDVEEACATIFNHDLYLSGNDRVVVRDNLILRASSIGLKMAANGTGASNDIVIENNVFAEGEIGISMGGNDDSDYRFTDAVVRDNVFTDIGRAQPTTRNLTWYIDIIDNDSTEVVGNLLVNQPDLGNERGIHVTGGSQRAVRVHDNTIIGLRRRALQVDRAAGWDSVSFEDNTVVAEGSDECLVQVTGGFGGVSYSGGAYASDAAGGTWFCVDGDRRTLAQWQTDSGESDATTADPTVPDPGRNLDRYAESLGLGSTLADFAAAARTLSRHAWRPELTAPAAANYLRAGFGVPER